MASIVAVDSILYCVGGDVNAGQTTASTSRATPRIAYLVSGWGPTNAALYQVNLASGATTLVGAIGCNERVRGLSVGREYPEASEATTWGCVKGVYR